MSDEKLLEDAVIGRDGLVYAEHPIRFERTPKRVRVVHGGATVADSSEVMLLTEHHKMPVYYFPVADVRMDLLEPTGRRRPDAHKGEQSMHTLRVDGKSVTNAAWTHEIPGDGGADFRGYVAFYWSKMDAWYEEDDQVYAHPRDPYHRVDVLYSSRRIQVVVLGEIVADSTRPRMLIETKLPPRFYLPRADVRTDLLVPSSTVSQCPYKGRAEHWSVRVGDTIAKDMAWTYRYPIAECPKIENLVCFYDERVDAVLVDGVERDLPATPWSKNRVLLSASD